MLAGNSDTMSANSAIFPCKLSQVDIAGGQGGLELVKEMLGQLFVPGKPPGVEGHDDGLLIHGSFFKVIKQKIQQGGLARAPGAIDGHHKALGRDHFR